MYHDCRKGAIAANRKERNIIRKTAEGIDEALRQLSSPDREQHIIRALIDLESPLEGSLSSKICGYYAMMLLAAHGYHKDALDK